MVTVNHVLKVPALTGDCATCFWFPFQILFTARNMLLYCGSLDVLRPVHFWHFMKGFSWLPTRTTPGQLVVLVLKEMEGITFGGMFMYTHFGKDIEFFLWWFLVALFCSLNYFCNFIYHDCGSSRLKGVAATFTQPVSTKITGMRERIPVKGDVPIVFISATYVSKLIFFI